jgi:hypothetical protein
VHGGHGAPNQDIEVSMHIVFQRPTIGDDEHDFQWAVTTAAGDVVSWHYSPEAGLLAAAGALDVDAATLRLVRRGTGRFAVVAR